MSKAAARSTFRSLRAAGILAIFPPKRPQPILEFLLYHFKREPQELEARDHPLSAPHPALCPLIRTLSQASCPCMKRNL